MRSKTHNVKCSRDSINLSSQSFEEENEPTFDWIDEEENESTFDWIDEEDIDDADSPWEGALIYKRNASITHVEYCTTLERLGLGEFSTEVSKSTASVMGLRVTKAVKDYPEGTPVQVSIDVTRKKRRLRLDGIIKTVLTLGCNRCGQPAAERIFANFPLLLTEEPIEEPETIDMEAILGRGQSNPSRNYEEGEDAEDALVDWDDRLYFRPSETEIDISKHVRDLIHLEITLNAVCDPMCKGICLKCGANLNTGSCSCSNEVEKKGFGPLGDLKKKMQKKYVKFDS